MTRSGLLVPNGVNGATGGFLHASMSLSDAAAAIHGPGDIAREKAIAQRSAGTLGLPFGVDPASVRDAGWAVVAAEEEAAFIHDALLPLIEHRKSTGDHVRCLTFTAGESRPKWLARHGVADGTINADKVPYYLLLAGKSSLLPFRFAHELAVEYAVGRVEFASAEEYRRYAEHLVHYEQSSPPAGAARTVAFFGPRHEFEEATQFSADHLLKPLADPARRGSAVTATRCTAVASIGADGTKQRLHDLFAGSTGTLPQVLFTASHGVGYPIGDPRQRSRQGALVCQDWRGPGSLRDDDCFAGSDVPDNDIEGLIAFLFACYGAGTPREDRFDRDERGRPLVIADQAFVAGLPRVLLRQGALAVVGHVDRAWGCSIGSAEAGDQIAPFNNFLGYTLTGNPIGYAMKDFASRYAALTVTLANLLERREYEDVQDVDLVDCWTERNDAEAYLVIGDPAARIHA